MAFNIKPIDRLSGEKASEHINQLTKPLGSLGRLESLAVQLAEITANPFPSVCPPGVLVFAADHGITEEGVSAFPSDVTALMAVNFSSGGAAINVFARMIEAQMTVVDIGIKGHQVFPGVQACKIRMGTANFVREKAMSEYEAEQAISTGREQAAAMIQSGVKCLIPGEMGIGNTTSSSALLAAITGLDVHAITGYGTGIEEKKKARKSELITIALEKHRPDKENALELLSAVGGLEIAGMCGAILSAAEHRIPILLDGFICTAAACLAVLISPNVRDYLIAGHLSEEPGHKKALEWLGLEPLLKLQLRLGEGSGAALAYPIVKGAAKMLCEMATFEQAGIK
ncbi:MULTISPECIES: nicotinate-nucleotide--dimethylbenzimidazole phosphoribosyltransferase [Bacillaceae]|uniref:Nicotinate-nucleotide--dimethylbenzimidazole phosphoribosyltransferase n=1 Tax=Metabacillus sediminis TaxID=3117746 RepID=A0ABZ2NN99_9BACI|nr:nicotinate-nucleotide--dimethylbenzimidazole phosphoribosyltransferase [Bacillus sp. SJS]KZZ83133.1 nicotinate-nucleotide--dimethylbenzimidazole phosphoribosyltransferase [Bacillus sp. SJS]